MPTLLHTIRNPKVKQYTVTCEFGDDHSSQSTVVAIKFQNEKVVLMNPYDLESCHEILVGDPSPIDIFDIADAQWEDKRYRLVFVDGEGATVEIWAEKVSHA